MPRVVGPCQGFRLVVCVGRGGGKGEGRRVRGREGEKRGRDEGRIVGGKGKREQGEGRRDCAYR